MMPLASANDTLEACFCYAAGKNSVMQTCILSKKRGHAERCGGYSAKANAYRRWGLSKE